MTSSRPEGATSALVLWETDGRSEWRGGWYLLTTFFFAVGTLAWWMAGVRVRPAVVAVLWGLLVALLIRSLWRWRSAAVVRIRCDPGDPTAVLVERAGGGRTRWPVATVGRIHAAFPATRVTERVRSYAGSESSF